MKNNKRGFTLVEVLAVILILGILVAIVVPSIYSLVNEAQEKEYNTVMGTFEASGLLYVDRHMEIVKSDIDQYGYHIITLNDLVDDGLLDAPIINPIDNEDIDLDKEIIITKEMGANFSACFEDRNCYIPTKLYNKLEAVKLEGADPTTQGLHYDSTNDYSYYKGANPNNWVEFNEALWRIVTMEGSSQDNSIKIIYEGRLRKNKTIENGKIGASVFNSINSNNYDSVLTIKTYLQEWYNTNITEDNKVLVESKNLCIGKTTYSASGVSKTTFFNDSCTTQTTNELSIGLLLGSDYLYASTETGCTSSTTTACKNNNYLYKNYEYYTITGETAGSNVWVVGNNLIPVSATTSKEIRPVLYLNSNTFVDRGDGSFESPYRVKLIYAADQTEPVITMVGDSPVDIIKGIPYIDAGATAIDNVDGNITNKIIVTSNLNINKVGTYYVRYAVMDRAGNISVKNRIINVTN